MQNAYAIKNLENPQFDLLNCDEEFRHVYTIIINSIV